MIFCFIQLNCNIYTQIVIEWVYLVETTQRRCNFLRILFITTASTLCIKFYYERYSLPKRIHITNIEKINVKKQFVYYY